MPTLRQLSRIMRAVLEEGGHVGIRHAIKRELVRVAMSRRVGMDVPDALMRQAKELLWETGYLVCSCQKGYFRAETEEEERKYGIAVYQRLARDAAHKLRKGWRAHHKRWHGPAWGGVHGVQQMLWDEWKGIEKPWSEVAHAA